ncbi:MAG: alanine--tRNA ligase [Eubacteriaceae bacterium]|jgi:alanyl-tRNA synthetase
MQPLGLNEIREKFLEFFESKDHLRLKSFSLVPVNDNSLLIINSGMAPMKPYFTGDEVPPRKRVTTCQKCIRTPDIENVGKTARHGTFFEMLGDFSFGDYFKNEIIPWSWEFCTEVMKMDPEKLWVTVYEDDDEAEEIWKNVVGVPAERIVRLGKEDNFWEHGTGPCGPCSEIYYDRGEKYGCGKPDCKPGCDCDRYTEFWNLVFSQFDHQEDGTYKDLIQKNIDTGMGLERLATIMQGVDNIFEVDTIRSILDRVCGIAGVTYGEDHNTDVSIRVITDHIRSVTFMIADGIMPGNEGRGYVLRRLLRRAVRHGKLLGINDLFLTDVADEVIRNYGGHYPELGEKQDYIKKLIRIEEERFKETIDQGMSLLESEIDEQIKEENKVFPGGAAFKLYDTYGFPVDLTKEILEERGLTLAEDEFDQAMDEQRERARNARKESNIQVFADDPFNPLGADAVTEFTGYEHFDGTGRVLGLIKDEELVDGVSKGDKILMLLDQTPFYAESGGQVGDKGQVLALEGEGSLNVEDVKKGSLGRHIISGTVTEGSFSKGEAVESKVDPELRWATQRNHTTTHLLQKALKMTLGEHVEQAGSFVSPTRLRFDFNHFEPMTDEEIRQVEKIVNTQILRSMNVTTTQMPIDEAKKLGAMALFGEKYGDIVRVVRVGDFSAELCGGCHISNSAQVGFFKILSESGVAAGIRRIEAATGMNAFNYVEEMDDTVRNAAQIVKSTPDQLEERLTEMNQMIRDKDRQITEMKSREAGSMVDELMQNAVDLGDGARAVIAKIDGADAEELRDIADKLRDALGSGAVLLAAPGEGKVIILAAATKDLVKKGFHAGNLVREAAKITGGGGGGRPDMAQAGGRKPEKLPEMFEKAPELIRSQLAAN